MILMKDGTSDHIIMDLNTIMAAKLLLSTNNVIGDCKQILKIMSEFFRLH